MKVSFDFDGTLTRPDVQRYAKRLIENNVEVYIVTARLSNNEAPSKRWNDDLYQIVDHIGLNRENIKFCGMSDKYHFFKDKDFIFHLDDDSIEVEFINEYTKAKGIMVFGNEQWESQCEMEIANRNSNI